MNQKWSGIRTTAKRNMELAQKVSEANIMLRNAEKANADKLMDASITILNNRADLRTAKNRIEQYKTDAATMAAKNRSLRQKMEHRHSLGAVGVLLFMVLGCITSLAGAPLHESLICILAAYFSAAAGGWTM